MRYNGKNRRFPAEGGGKYMKLDNYVDIKVFILYLMKNVGEPLEFI